MLLDVLSYRVQFISVFAEDLCDPPNLLGVIPLKILTLGVVDLPPPSLPPARDSELDIRFHRQNRALSRNLGFDLPLSFAPCVEVRQSAAIGHNGHRSTAELCQSDFLHLLFSDHE